MRYLNYSRFSLITVLIALLIVPSACKKAEQSGPIMQRAYAPAPARKKNMDGFLAGEAKPEVGANAPTAGRKIIVTQTLALEVRDLDAAFRNVTALAKGAGGYTTETSRSRNDDGSYSASIEMRVPPAGVSSLLEKLRAAGVVVSESSNGEDITDDYVDLEARLRNMRASEVRLQEILTRRTPKLADVLAVERELTRVRSEIDSFEARKRTWNTLTSLVTVRIELTEPRGAFPVAFKVWNPVRTAFGEALEAFASSLHTAIVAAGTILPWAPALGFGIYWILKKTRKRQPAGCR